MTESYTIDFEMLPRASCTHGQGRLVPIEGTKQTFKIICVECEKRVKVVDGRLELVEDKQCSN